jgi:hypothetical protein
MVTKKLFVALAAGVVLCWCVGAVQADTLVLDQFLNTGSDQALNDMLGSPRQTGSAVPVGGISYTTKQAGSGGTVVWFGNDSTNAPGWGGVYTTQSATQSAWMDKDFTQVVGKKYEAAVSIDYTSGTAGPGFLAVAETQDGGSRPATGACADIGAAGGWNLYLNGVLASSGSVGTVQAHTLLLAMDETGGSSTSVSLKVDGAEVATGSLSWGSGDRYLGVGKLVGSQSTIYVDNLSLVIPEPSSLGIMVSSIIGLLAYAWRKRR